MAEQWLLAEKHAVYGLAVARILLGLTIIGFTLSNFSTRVYTFGAGAAWTGELAYPNSDFATIWPFSFVNGLATNDSALTLLMLSILVTATLFLVGYKTRLVTVVLFVQWVGLLSINTLVQDQSDNLSRIALISLFFTAPSQVWSVDARRRERARPAPSTTMGALRGRVRSLLPPWVPNLFHNLSVIVIGAQLCMVYASGGLYKAQGEPWYSGYAIYAPITTRQFGTWPELSELLTAWAPLVALATVLTVLVQVSFPLMLMRRPTRIAALLIILIFHVSIAVLMGLPWFSLTMVALDAIFIRDKTYMTIARTVRTTVVERCHHRFSNATLRAFPTLGRPGAEK
ncbi:HTTM domain-containing protein [Frigoribacterium sp. PhB24]|uniref:HTTM domain-containing protein n=1 Tax=Frigoribacterium sp. PhB24 TaxID=2485204 RepID=UPI00131513DB|nr:HTTM domain-containing protein [Frigoribacterium sp. PhB24]